MNQSPGSVYVRFWKPLIDRFFALLGLVLFWPLLVLLLAINYFIGLPGLFIHQRPGKNSKPFLLLKLCTIHPKTSEISRYGQFLRNCSLDELPQLINILAGHMSFIGPRPLLMEYLEAYDERAQRRHQVLPGITGWAQVNGRNELSLEAKVDLDLEYVDQLSFALDVKILMKTFVQMLRFDQADGHDRKVGHESRSAA
ncbi:sugar transferase [Marinoscillum sp. MHG1-6]|uniref:sugar transferase n=1 Tax=Marinoscillum sp. MHG1-6 TaxID=2959627 RepID=UPI002157A2B6|nr:sugar transferase [Marinoscillum sp. MHG1-6]